MWKRSPVKFVIILALAFVLSNCVTVNINVNFPEQEVKSAAEEIESEVRGGVIEEEPVPPQSWNRSKSSVKVALAFGLPAAFAQDDEEDIDFKKTNPVIRKIVSQRKERFPKINEFLSAGYIGEATDGFLEVIEKADIPLPKLAQVRQIIRAENEDRARLFREIAKINDIPEEQFIRVQTTWAETNRKMLQPGQYYEKGNGQWVKKTQEEYEKERRKGEGK